jgi:Dehydrogenases with different specificities (related to short-chain alcohol dehydrogenases)
MNRYHFEDMYMGMTESFQVTITEDKMLKFCEISGDVNPLHRDPVFARERGFDGQVVYGMLSSAFYSTLVGVYLPGENALLQELRIRMIRPVYIGDVLTVTGVVKDIREATKRIKIGASVVSEIGGGGKRSRYNGWVYGNDMRKIYLIAGASSDIGTCYIRHLCTSEKMEEIVVIAHYNCNRAGLEEIALQYPHMSLELIQADVSISGGIDKVIDLVQKKYGVPTHLIFLAAKELTYKRITDFDAESYLAEINTQVVFCASILRTFLPAMAAQQYGKILIFLSSCTIGVPPKFMAEYCSIKYALLGLMKSVAVEYGDQGININGLSPAMVDTKFVRNVGRKAREMSAESNPKHRNLMPEDLLEAMDFLLSDRAIFLNGVNLNMSGGGSM